MCVHVLGFVSFSLCACVCVCISVCLAFCTIGHRLTTLATAYIGGHTYSSGLSGFNSYKQFSDCPVPISNPLYEKPQLISFGKSSFSNFLPLTVTLNLHGRLNFTVSIVLLLLALVSSCCWYWRWPSWRVISTSTQQAPPICLPLVRSSDRL